MQVEERSTRRRTAPTKGDLRERAILDAAEQQLNSTGGAGMTVATIAQDAGITRGALYFYFGSKNEVLAALVERTVTELRAEVDAVDTAASAPGDAVRQGIERTARMWREHGTVMRTAVELSPSVPAIDQAWRSAVIALADTMGGVAERAGLPSGTAAEVAAALVWMTERVFYQAFVADSSLDDAAATLTRVWLSALGIPA
ncbi:TetR/AcrR family transcriptional regulator [Amycolatopsis rubida]|uniref:DNA-binding transcriptional regulator, AcrR family n=1 Tax=Amycolatopsis rubida TaxID=112413 RepID=A0A1I6BGJ1_9PSEU|nr:TetR family transcriptional regulator [Amycolatopsis rubida]NEC56194.1 TetR/AcrR family transcriptional regulator [Amycolatopsis rubida]OAP21061.1 HTH-type transcriptional regulator EthR [Amycolatopsis sp. M39]SFQ79907.1 DNA-binding transcriptional regulator, AcrR family [Amycolatopsis rubida]